MTSSKPYLIRALYEWIVDNDMTPQILVQASEGRGQLPSAHVKDGKIVLNISPSAVRGLELGDIDIAFSARFGGTPMQVLAPVSQVLAIYARENGQGMLFNAEDDPDDSPPDSGGSDDDPPKPSGGKPKLTLVQ